MRQVVYSPQSANAYPIGKRRVGAPRQQWRHFTQTYLEQTYERMDGLFKHGRAKQANPPNGSRTTILSCRSAGPRTL